MAERHRRGLAGAPHDGNRPHRGRSLRGASRATGPSTRTATVVLAAPDDEYHDLGLRMLADRFTLAGWRAHLLGAAVPVTQAIKAVSTLGADAIVLSASTHFHRLSIRPYVDELTRAHPGLQVWVGGPAFAHEHEGWPEGMILDPSSVPAPGAG